MVSQAIIDAALSYQELTANDVAKIGALNILVQNPDGTVSFTPQAAADVATMKAAFDAANISGNYIWPSVKTQVSLLLDNGRFINLLNLSYLVDAYNASVIYDTTHGAGAYAALAAKNNGFSFSDVAKGAAFVGGAAILGGVGLNALGAQGTWASNALGLTGAGGLPASVPAAPVAQVGGATQAAAPITEAVVAPVGSGVSAAGIPGLTSATVGSVITSTGGALLDTVGKAVATVGGAAVATALTKALPVVTPAKPATPTPIPQTPAKSSTLGYLTIAAILGAAIIRS